MRNFLLVVLVLASARAGLAVIVDGRCRLEGQSNHSGIQVKFIQADTLAVTDSTYSDASGYFFIGNLHGGSYDVVYSHAGFDTVRLGIIDFAANTAIPLVRLLPPCPSLSGPLSGVLGPGYYRIVGNISVNVSDTLCLMAGTLLRFDSSYSCQVNGMLLTEGIEGDSVVFTTNQLGPKRWRGLRFPGSSSSGSRLAYCIIERGFATGASPSNKGGGAYCSGSSPTFTNCTFQDNKAAAGGGGVYCLDSSPTFTYCSFRNDTATSSGGGGVYCSRSSAIFDNCTFEDNKTTSGSGGGVYCTHSSPAFTNCTLRENIATLGSGGGVYCDSSLVLERCTMIGNSAWEGGGAYCSGFSPTFTNCTLSGNSAHYGGGVYCSQSSPIFANCILNGDTAIWWGGGAYCFESLATFTNCTFQDNTSTPGSGGGLCCFGIPSPILSECTFSHNSAYDGGGGLYCSESSPNLTNCTLTGNSAWDGSGVYCDNSSSPLLTNCILSGNSASWDGGGLYCCAFSSPVFTNCTLSGNSAPNGGGAYCSRSSPTFNSTIIALSTGSEICFLDSTACSFKYCDIFDTTGLLLEGVIPDSLGELCCTNVNGDSCDAFYNIFLGPMFVNSEAGDFHLAEGSPCIDAGDPSLPLDPNSTIADIGAFYYYLEHAEKPTVLLPTSHALCPNWPNPFNSTTMIRYEVAQAGQVRLTIFNLLGQEVAMLVDGRQLAGTHTIAWNAGDLPSGVYFCQMEVARFVQTRKLMLVK